MREGWEKVRLGDISSMQYGFTATADRSKVGPKFVRITDIVPDLINWDNVPYCKIRESEYERYKLKKGDILVARTGATAGYAKLIRKLEKSVFASYLIRIRPNEKCYSGFIGTLIESKIFKSFIDKVKGGAAQPQANAPVIKEFTFHLPPIPTQKIITKILSEYDDLIETNTRRIHILEEMAQRIYKEWFVDFKYPRYENDEMVESELGMIPGGWEVITLGEVLKTIESGSRPKGGIDPAETEVVSIGAENILGLGKYNFSKEKYINREFFDNMTKGHIQSNDVLLYKDGAKLGRKSMFMENFPHKECCINEHVFILRSNEKCSQFYLYFWLDQPRMTTEIINLNSNAAQPGINQKGVKSLKILIADNKVMQKFDDIVKSILSELFILAKKNRLLQLTRDLLLPKLISGKIDVSEMDIDTGELE